LRYSLECPKEDVIFCNSTERISRVHLLYGRLELLMNAQYTDLPVELQDENEDDRNEKLPRTHSLKKLSKCAATYLAV